MNIKNKYTFEYRYKKYILNINIILSIAIKNLFLV